MSLYYVKATDEESYRWDLMAVCVTPEQAVHHWFQHFGFEAYLEPVTVQELTELRFRSPGPVDWESVPVVLRLECYDPNGVMEGE